MRITISSVLMLVAVIFGLGIESVFAQDKSTVPYYRQYDNAKEGGSACNITSVSMMLDYFGIEIKNDAYSRTPDKVYERFGIKGDPEELRAVFNVIAREAGSDIRAVFHERATIQQLREEVTAGNPVIIHGWFTVPGHIMVVTGFDGENYIVNDPAGRWNLKKWGENAYDTSVSGQNILYPAAEFEHAINDNGTGDDLWLHVFRKLGE